MFDLKGMLLSCEKDLLEGGAVLDLSFYMELPILRRTIWDHSILKTLAEDDEDESSMMETDMNG